MGRGFSLVEVLISVVIFSAVILALAGLAFQVARRATRATDRAHVMAALQGRVDLASTVAVDSLVNVAGCENIASGNVTITACTTVTDSTARLKKVVIIVSTNIPGGRPDTVQLLRGRTRTAIPLR